MPSLLEAIEMKYGVIEHQMCGEGLKECNDVNVSIFVPKKSPRVCIPSLLVLNDFDIETAGDGNEIEHKCAGVEELDLAMNKLEEWSEIISIFEHMPRLKFANLSFNTLTSPLNREIDSCWNHLRSLVLNSTHIDWRSVRRLVELLPELEELHLSFNDYTNVDLEEELTETNENGFALKLNKSKCQCSISIDDYCIDIDNDDEDDEDNLSSVQDSHVCNRDKSDTTIGLNSADSNCNSCNTEHQMRSSAKIDSCKACTFLKSSSSSSSNSSNRKRVIHEKIKKLHFTGNPVKEWSEIVKLGQSFPNLESLVLADCPIKTLEITSANHLINSESVAARKSGNSRTLSIASHEYFQRLLFLNLNCTAISDWIEIERIAKFPKLQCLRIQGCPLWESHENTQHERRQYMIARLSNISMLNGGGVISPEEREAAERAFIRHYLDKSESEKPERYAELVAIHGQLEPLANVDMRPEKRVKVTFTFKDRSEIRSVDVYRTVADLKTKLEPITGLQAIRMRLFYVDQDLRHIQGPEEMKYASKQLYSYNIRSGDEIIVDQKKRTHSSTSS